MSKTREDYQRELQEYQYFYNLIWSKLNKLMLDEMDKSVDKTYLPKEFEDLLKKDEE